jgi:hypothetical protein
VSDYPPFTPVRVVGVHQWPLWEGEQWACMLGPDALPGGERYDWRCAHCTEAAERRIAELGDRTMWWQDKPWNPQQVVTLSWLVERARALNDEADAQVFGL